MAGINYKISFDLNTQLQIMGVVNRIAVPLMSRAVKEVAKGTAAKWQQAVDAASLWEGEKKPYMASISWEMTGDFSAYVSSDYKYAQDIETGRPSRDLKKMLDTSDKVRMSKKGLRYLIIPFRHNAAGSSASSAMPAHVYAQARALSASSIVGQGTRVSGHGAWSTKTKAPVTVNQSKYLWGGRLGKDGGVNQYNAMFGGAAGKLGASAGKKYAGMVRFNTSTGGAKSSAYLTFRVMVEGSSGWITKPKAGLFLVKKVAETMQPLATSAFEKAIQLQLARG